jgi:hypothetical protein
MISCNLDIIWKQLDIYKTSASHTHKHTQTLDTTDCLKNLWMFYLWLLFELLFHIFERNDGLSQLLSLCKRQGSYAAWYGYNLFHDQKVLHCEGHVTRRTYTACCQNVAQYFGAYMPHGIPTNFQIYPVNTTIHCLCYTHKHERIAQKHAHIDTRFANANQLVAAI